MAQRLINEYVASTDEATRAQLETRLLARVRLFDKAANARAGQTLLDYCGVTDEWVLRSKVALEKLVGCKAAGQILDYGLMPIEQVSSQRPDGCLPYRPQAVVLRGTLQWERRNDKRFLTLLLVRPICTVGRSFDPAAISYANIGRLTAIYSDNTAWLHSETVPVGQLLSFRGQLGGDRYFDGRTPVFIYGKPISESVTKTKQ